MTEVQSETVASAEPVLETPTAADTPRPRPSEDDITEAMKDVVDPELGINVVDLGLLYGNQVHEDHTVTRRVTSSPQVGFTWWTSTSYGSCSPL